MTKAEAERRRKARNEYSRKWKKAHPKQVKKWNSEWLAAQKRVAKKAGKKKPAHRKPSPATVHEMPDNNRAA